MGLFDSIAGAVGSALGQDNQSGEGAHNILSDMLRQGGTGQSGNIVGSLLGGLGGAQGGMASTLETLAANGLGEEVSSWMSTRTSLPIRSPATPRRAGQRAGATDGASQRSSDRRLPEASR